MNLSSLRSLASLAVITFLAASCGASDGSGASNNPQGVETARSLLARNLSPSSSDVSALGVDNQRFAFDLLHQVDKDPANDGKNVVISPYSVSSALAMTYAGARGTTASEMKQVLRFTLEQPALHVAFNATDLALSARGQGAVGADGTPFRLNVDNSIWAQRGYPVVPAFLDLLAVNYGAAVYLADFAKAPEASRKAINTWVEDTTEKLIPELLPSGSIDTSTRFVLTNTVYFNASWAEKFEKASTTVAPFRKLEGSQVDVDMMHALLRLSYASGSGYRAVALPYASDELQFIAILPDEGKYTELEAALSSEWLSVLTGSWKTIGVDLKLPRLDYKLSTSLKTALEALGMKSAFTAADFSGLTSEEVAVDDVIHEAVISVFESGTIAAAATAVIIREVSVLVPEEVVVLDRPFLYAVVDKPTGALLFVGRVLDPTAH